MVLADDVALVAAVFSFDAAAVTLVAAAETARGVVAAVVRGAVVRAAVVRVVAGLAAAVAVAGLDVERLAEEPAGFAAAFAFDVVAFAELALAAPDLAVSVGTDLPPRS
jgi:hypothetical protein